MNLKIIDDFFNPSDFGLMLGHFLNAHFDATYQSNEMYHGGVRELGYPCYQTLRMSENNLLSHPYKTFLQTLKKKIDIDFLHCDTFFRKTKINELKNSPSYKQYRPHKDDSEIDVAGVIYYNSNSLVDGTRFYNETNSFEETIIIGSKFNRCVIYDSQIPHCPPHDQSVDERWVQPFFLITKKETYDRRFNGA